MTTALDHVGTLTERHYVEWAKTQPDHSRPILCPRGHEVDRAVRIRNHFVWMLDGVAVYRARLRCPECLLDFWFHAVHVMAAEAGG